MLGQPCQMVTYGELGARAAVPNGDLWRTGCSGSRANWLFMGNWVLGQPCQMATYGELGAGAAVPTG